MKTKSIKLTEREIFLIDLFIKYFWHTCLNKKEQKSEESKDILTLATKLKKLLPAK